MTERPTRVIGLVTAIIGLLTAAVIFYVETRSEITDKSSDEPNEQDAAVAWLSPEERIAGPTEVYSAINLTYSVDPQPEDVQVIVYKCLRESCSNSSELRRIPTALYYLEAQSCFVDMPGPRRETCFEKFEIDGDKAPPSGFVVSLDNAKIGSQQFYLIGVSAKDDLYATKHIRIQFTTEFSDWDFIREDFSFSLDKVRESIPSINSVELYGARDGTIDISKGERLTLRAEVCRPFNITTDYYRPSFQSGYSDYSAEVEVRVSLSVEGIAPYVFSAPISVDASSCTPFKETIRMPVEFFDAESVNVQIEATVKDTQALSARSDSLERTLFIKDE